jgi:hypothetical protein
MNSDVLMKLTMVTNDNPSWFTMVIVVLRLATDNCATTDYAIVADGGVSENVRMRTNLAAVANSGRRLDHTVRTNLAAVADSGTGHDNGRGVNCGL